MRLRRNRFIEIVIGCSILLSACTGGTGVVRADLAGPIGDDKLAAVGPAQEHIGTECDPEYQSLKERGIGIAEGWRVLCPGQAADETGRQHWGITCFSGTGPEGECPYVSINLRRIGSNSAKRYYVIAHELCHATGIVNERSADLCAKSAGATLAYSPY